MTPLQKIAMGLIIVVGSAPFPAHPHPSWRHYDLLPDPLGWLLVIAGLLALRRLHESFDTAAWLAILALLVSVPLWLPQLNHHLDASGAWLASMPQTVCCLLTAHHLARAGAFADPPDRYVAHRFGLLVWGFGLLVVLPVLAIGGHLDQLSNATVALSLLVNLAFVYYLFMVNRRTWLGGPGPRVRESKAG